MIPRDYMERLYASWLGKIIGIRLGAPVEGWTSDKIERIYGELEGYPVDYREFAADDDSNGPLFFLRALKDGGHGADMTAEDVAEALLNYAPFEHGFFWWGGYGVSTEHTAYLNLVSGIPAPRSGSIAQNGAAVAEQIGGQIFIDTWGMVAPGNPGLAVRLAERAASVTHGGNGVYGGMFVAACVSLAFVEPGARATMEKALRYIPENCEYARAVRDVLRFHDERGDGDWRACLRFVQEHYGYDRYPGACHIIPNAAVVALALAYGEDDFDRALRLSVRCGWDTDCNAGNVGAIMGALRGVEGIDHGKWIRPVGDLLICSSVVGSLNIMDLPYGAGYIASLAFELAGETPPEPWCSLMGGPKDRCHFEFPHSTHAFRIRTEAGRPLEARLENTQEAAHTGRRALKVVAARVLPAQRVFAYKKTYFIPSDFHDSRYDPSFSPLLYPGQRLDAFAMAGEGGPALSARLYVRDARTGAIIAGEAAALPPGEWTELSFRLPPMNGALLDEAGLTFEHVGERESEIIAYVDDFCYGGAPDYAIDFARENTEFWSAQHNEVSQMTRLKGLMYLEDGRLHLSCADFGEAYTGRHDFADYEASFRITPLTGAHHYALFRVQGGVRSYGFGFDGEGRLALYKKSRGGRVTLAEAPFDWRPDEYYDLSVRAEGGLLTARCGGVELRYDDGERPYLQGSIGCAVREGSHAALSLISVRGIAAT